MIINIRDVYTVFFFILSVVLTDKKIEEWIWYMFRKSLYVGFYKLMQFFLSMKELFLVWLT